MIRSGRVCRTGAGVTAYKYAAQRGGAVVEYLLQVPAHKQPVDQAPTRHRVVDAVDYESPVGMGLETVLVRPFLVGAADLDVNEPARGISNDDLAAPAKRETAQPQAVVD